MAKRWTEYIPLDEIVRDPGNEKLHADTDIQRAVSQLGVIDQMSIDERTGYLIEGHGRLDAYLYLHGAGRPMPEGLELLDDGRWAAPVSRGWSSRNDDERDAARIGLNRIGEKAGYDERRLLAGLDHLDEVGLLLTTGFTDNDRELLERRLDPPPPPEEDFPTPRGSGGGEITCPACGEEFQR